MAHLFIHREIFSFFSSTTKRNWKNWIGSSVPGDDAKIFHPRWGEKIGPIKYRTTTMTQFRERLIGLWTEGGSDLSSFARLKANRQIWTDRSDTRLFHPPNLPTFLLFFSSFPPEKNSAVKRIPEIGIRCKRGTEKRKRKDIHAHSINIYGLYGNILPLLGSIGQLNR